MRRRIISVLLCLSVILSIFCLTVSAEDGQAAAHDLKAEIKENISSFDESELSDRKFTVLGGYTNIQEVKKTVDASNPEFDVFLYLYIYNPGGENFSRFDISDLTVSLLKDGNSYAEHKYNYSAIFSERAKSSDNKYYKFAFPLTAAYNLLDSDEYDTIIFSWETMKFGNISLLQKNSFEVSPRADGSSNISFRQSEVATLDVHYTSYNCAPKEDTYSVRDEIHTVYFSIPDKYKEYYDYLYSVTSTYYKKLTTPILISNEDIWKIDSEILSLTGYDFSIVDNEFAYIVPTDKGIVPGTIYISPDFTMNLASANSPYTYISSAYYGSESLEGAIVGDWIFTISDKHLSEKFYYVFYSQLEDFYISQERLLDYINEYKDSNLKLFETSEYFKESTKTINESWSSIPYFQKASFWQLCNDYGFKIAFKIWNNRDDQEKLQEIANQYPENNFDFNAFQSQSQPYLVLCDSAVKADIFALSDKEVSDKYFIALEDVPDFRNFLKTEKNVVLYRFDISERFSVNLVNVSELTSIDNPLRADENILRNVLASYVQQYVYTDFSVIDVSFKKEGSYLSLNTYSDPIDVTGDIVAPDAPIPVPGAPELGDVIGAIPLPGGSSVADVADYWKNVWKNLQDRFSEFLKVVRYILITAAAVVVFLFAIRIVEVFKRPKIIIRDSDKKDKK